MRERVPFTMTTAIYTHPDCKRHEMGELHPESPARLQAIEDQLILSRIDGFLDHRQAPLAELADIGRVHTADAIALVRDHVPPVQSQPSSHDRCSDDSYYWLDPDTALNAYSYHAALRAAGAAVAATDAVIAGDIDNAFCAIRPPGHHARPSAPMGFCMFNNVAIAARHALEVHGLQRVAIVDFDVHHGNGTEAILINQPGAAFLSIHQYPCYPGTGTADVGDNCFNFPVAPRTPREEYRRVFSKAFERLKKFKPELVAVSAGFDAYARDPLAQETLEAEDYHWLGQTIRGLGVPTFSLLEGGYSDDLPELIFAYLKGLDGK